MHRLLAMNIDGTVLQPNGKVDKSVKEAVEYVQNKGVKVTLLTSRNFASAKRVAKALRVNTLIIAHHGAFIGSSIDQALFVKRIDESILSGLLQFLESFPCQVHVVNETITVTNKQPAKSPLLGRTVVDMSNSTSYQHQFVDKVSSYVEEEEVHPTHIEVKFADRSLASDVRAAIEGMYFEIDVNQYREKLVILPNGVSKLKALLYIGEHWRIPLHEMVAISSKLTDLDIIEAVGLGVAMGNAPKELKQAADWITRSSAEHGVDYMIREHFRKQQPIEFIERLKQF